MAHKTLIDGTAYDISGGKTLVDGTAYSIEKGVTMVDGTVREIAFWPEGLHLNMTSYDSRNGTVIDVTETDSQLSATVTGGTGTDYSGVQWELRNGQEWHLLQKGDRVQFSFTGSRYYGDYATYGIAFFTDVNSAWSSYVYTRFNSSASNVSYTVTTPCYCMLIAQVGGLNNSTINAAINITKFTVNYETVWSK